MPEAKDIISLLQDTREDLSKAERRLANVILEDIQFALHSSIVEIAKRANTSTPTLTRLSRRLGFDGFKDFKLCLAQSLAVGSRYIQTRVEPKNIQDVASNVINSVQQALMNTHKQLDYAALSKAVEWMAHSRKVVIFGGGGGGSITALAVEYRVFRLGINAVAYHDSQLQRMMASTLKTQDILFTISTSGRSQDMIDCAAIAKEYHARVIALTRPNSPLAKAVDLVIPVDIPENEDILQPTESRYALLAIVDILATELAYRLGDSAIENLRRIKYQLVSYRDDDDSQPLGD